MRSIFRKRSVVREIFLHKRFELSTANVISVGRRDIFSWLIHTQPFLEPAVARSQVGQIMEEFACHVVDVLPPANYMCVDQNRYVERQCLRYNSRRCVVDLWNEQELALADIIEGVAMPKEGSLQNLPPA